MTPEQESELLQRVTRLESVLKARTVYGGIMADHIITSVCSHFGIQRQELLGAGRTYRVCRARFAAAELMKRSGMHLREISTAMHKKCHGAALHWTRMCAVGLEHDVRFKKVFELVASDVGLEDVENDRTERPAGQAGRSQPEESNAK